MSKLTLKLFTAPFMFPCGPDSDCCGPVGQSEEEVKALKEGFEQALDVNVEVITLTDAKVMREYRDILKVFHSFGWNAIPIVAINGEVVSMGETDVGQLIGTVKEKLAPTWSSSI
jgi:hypothetical protein